jgi:hypothetical protein
MRLLLLACLCAAAATQQFHYTPGKIRGIVLYQVGGPVANAKVQAHPLGVAMAGIVPWAQTGKDGRFQIEHLDPREYFVSAEKTE